MHAVKVHVPLTLIQIPHPTSLFLFTAHSHTLSHWKPLRYICHLTQALIHKPTTTTDAEASGCGNSSAVGRCAPPPPVQARQRTERQTVAAADRMGWLQPRQCLSSLRQPVVVCGVEPIVVCDRRSYSLRRPTRPHARVCVCVCEFRLRTQSGYSCKREVGSPVCVLQCRYIVLTL